VSSRRRFSICPLAPAHLAGLAAIQLAIVLAFIEPWLAVVPVGLFLALSVTAPFFAGWGFFLPVVTRGRKAAGSVALTFDDGPDPGTTPRLLDLLDRHDVKAAFFVVGYKAEKHPRLIKEIIDRGHEIGNHTMNHDTLVMLKPRHRLQSEVAECQRMLGAQGLCPVAFRPPVGIVNPRLWGVLLEQGMYCVTFSRRGKDFGNRMLKGTASRVQEGLAAGDIIALHDGMPAGGMEIDLWLEQVSEVISEAKAGGLEFSLLSEAIGRPVMRAGDCAGAEDAVALFYDSLVYDYDAEQLRASQSSARNKERELALGWMKADVRDTDRVLEIGAGTGRLTLDLAKAAGHITAVDISGRMLEELKAKAAAAGIWNIDYVAGDIHDLAFEQEFDRVCAFSSLEYVADLNEVMARLSGCLKPGGKLYFVTAHRSFFRFWTQIGNAMRQGIWLHARGRNEISELLQRAGMTPERIEDHCLKSALTRGILLEVCARKV